MREENEIHKLVTLCKILVVLIIALIIVELFFSAREVKAGTITGDTPLAGISLLRQMVIDSENDLPEVEDIKLLAEVMYHENWHTDKDHKAAYYTGAVVLNRVRSDEPWMHLNGDKTIYDVIYAKGQYSTTRKFFTVELPQECYEMAKHLLMYGAPDVPKTVVYQAMFKQGSGVWKKINTDYFCYE